MARPVWLFTASVRSAMATSRGSLKEPVGAACAAVLFAHISQGKGMRRLPEFNLPVELFVGVSLQNAIYFRNGKAARLDRCLSSQTIAAQRVRHTLRTRPSVLDHFQRTSTSPMSSNFLISTPPKYCMPTFRPLTPQVQP